MFQGKKRVISSTVLRLAAACCLAAAMLAAPVWALEATAAAPVPEATPEAVENIQPQVPGVAEDEEDELGAQAIQTLSFKEGTTISAALRMLQLKYHKNIIPISRLEGQINVTELFDVTFEEALQAINGSIMVYTPEEYEKMKDDKRRMETRVFTLYYISAEEAKTLLAPALSESGSIEATAAPEVGISSGDDLSVQEGGNSMSLHDAIVIKDYPENIAEAESLIKRLDVRPLQVLIEATILSATLTEGLDLGVDLNFMAGTSLSGTAATSDIVDSGTISRGTAATPPIAGISGLSGTPIETSGFATAGMNGIRIGISTGDVRVFISALETVTDVTVLANPKILALNKQVGTVFIGQNLGYRSSTTVSGSGVASSGEVKFLKSGTKLSFRPYITDDGYIRMDIYPKDSSATKDSDGVPTETTAELTTNIMVKDGQTIVIGGLFRDSITSSRSQVPLLGDVPVVGELFKGTTDQSVRQEVIILLTPHIIEAPLELKGDERAADIERKRSPLGRCGAAFGGKLHEGGQPLFGRQYRRRPARTQLDTDSAPNVP